MDSAYYHLSHFRAEMNTREEFTTIDNIKPASTPEPERKVVEGDKEIHSNAYGATGGIAGYNPSASVSVSRTDTKESSSAQESKVLSLKIMQKNHDGAFWWEFNVNDHYQRQQGVDMQESNLPCVSCTFEARSDALSSLAPDLFSVEVMSCWSLIPLEGNHIPLLWPALGSSEVKPPTPYSNLCQIMLLDLPSQLSKNSHGRAVAEAKPFSWMAFDVKCPSPCKFTSDINFSSSKGGPT